MIEEFGFTTAQANDQLAELTWSRKDWIERISNHPTINVERAFTRKSKFIAYEVTKFKHQDNLIFCETLSQMQF